MSEQTLETVLNSILERLERLEAAVFADDEPDAAEQYERYREQVRRRHEGDGA